MFSFIFQKTFFLVTISSLSLTQNTSFAVGESSHHNLDNDLIIQLIYTHNIWLMTSAPMK